MLHHSSILVMQISLFFWLSHGIFRLNRLTSLKRRILHVSRDKSGFGLVSERLHCTDLTRTPKRPFWADRGRSTTQIWLWQASCLCLSAHFSLWEWKQRRENKIRNFGIVYANEPLKRKKSVCQVSALVLFETKSRGMKKGQTFKCLLLLTSALQHFCPVELWQR
jgi:hypothetical protein